MLDFETVRAFVVDMGDCGRISIQDSMGNIVTSQTLPEIEGLLETGVWFRIKNGEWMTPLEFQKIVAEWQNRGLHGSKS
jgi:hypothetical protein